MEKEKNCSHKDMKVIGSYFSQTDIEKKMWLVMRPCSKGLLCGPPLTLYQNLAFVGTRYTYTISHSCSTKLVKMTKHLTFPNEEECTYHIELSLM